MTNLKENLYRNAIAPFLFRLKRQHGVDDSKTAGYYGYSQAIETVDFWKTPEEACCRFRNQISLYTLNKEGPLYWYNYPEWQTKVSVSAKTFYRIYSRLYMELVIDSSKLGFV